jgi:hypothetical protein
VRIRVDIGVHADRDARLAPASAGKRRQLLELGLRFDIEAQDVLLKRISDLALRLADAREHDLFGRHTHRAGAAQLPFGDDVHAGAETGERGEHGLIGIGLHGVTDERRHIGKNSREGEVLLLEARARVKIDGCADL